MSGLADSLASGAPWIMARTTDAPRIEKPFAVCKRITKEEKELVSKVISFGSMLVTR